MRRAAELHRNFIRAHLLRLRLICIKGVLGHASMVGGQSGVQMSGRPSSASLCLAYGDASSTSSNSYVPWRFPRGEENAHAGSRPVERIWSVLSVGGLRAVDSPVVRQCSSLPPQGLAVYMKFIYCGSFFAVEFLWGPGPLCRRHERILSCFPDRDRLLASPCRHSSADVDGGHSHDVRVSPARRGAGRGRPDPGRASSRGGCGHSDPPGIRNRLNAAFHLRNHLLLNRSAPTMSTCEILVLRFLDDFSFVKGSA